MSQNLENVISGWLSRDSSAIAKWVTRGLLVVCGSGFLALCARASVPLPSTPVPVTLSNFGVLLVGLLLGSRLAPGAAILYLVEGAAGLPVFSNGSLGLFGPTGGYLWAYPVAAFAIAILFERLRPSFFAALAAALLGELVIFSGGISWLVAAFHVPFAQAAHWGFYPFLVAELAKLGAAAGLATRFTRPKNS
jgi:biotin transport system substrate-specific component